MDNKHANRACVFALQLIPAVIFGLTARLY